MGVPEAQLPGSLTSGPAALKVAARIVTDQLNGLLRRQRWAS
jgi:hypothetical protein